MDTLDRFLTKEFLIYFILVWLGLASFYLGIDFLTKFWSIQLSVANVLALYLYKIPAALQTFVPVASLMSTLIVLSNMSRQNEILALYASGIGTLRLVSVFLAIVAIISTVSFITFDSLVPIFAKRQILVAKGLDPSQEQMLSFNQTRFWYRSGSILYNVGQFIPDANRLEDVNIYILSTSFRVIQKIHAQLAHYSNNDWILENGFVITYPEDSHYPQSEQFTAKKGIIPEKPGDFRTLKLDEDTMRLRDLRKYIARNRTYGFDTTTPQVNYHERIALVFSPLIFVLFGIPFGVKPLRSHSVAKSVAFCFISIFLYLLFFKMTLSLGKGGHLPPIVAGWLPNLAFFGYGSLTIWRKL